MRHITASELKSYLEKSQHAPILLDVREPWEYQICHLANSKLIPMSQIMRAMNELDPQQEHVLICHHGVRSQRVGAFLDQSVLRRYRVNVMANSHAAIMQA